MLTLKHIDPRGNEHVKPVDSVDFAYEANTVYANVGETTHTFEQGEVYVMESGKTVAKYHLSELERYPRPRSSKIVFTGDGLDANTAERVAFYGDGATPIAVNPKVSY